MDGRLSGQEVIQTINCDQSANTCVIPVPGPGAALVFISNDAQALSDPKASQTYSTTTVTNAIQTLTVEPSVLAHSNGHSGSIPLSGTSKGGANAAVHAHHIDYALTLLSVLLGFFVTFVWC